MSPGPTVAEYSRWAAPTSSSVSAPSTDHRDELRRQFNHRSAEEARMDLDVRDAVEADAETLGAIVDLPADALRNVVHDRTVRIAVEPPSDPGPNADVEPEADDAAGAADESVLGFVAFDVREGTVHVTQLAGDAEVAEHLLAEPVRFAVNEGFDVSFVVPTSDADAEAVCCAAASGVRRGDRKRTGAPSFRASANESSRTCVSPVGSSSVPNTGRPFIAAIPSSPIVALCTATHISHPQ